MKEFTYRIDATSGDHWLELSREEGEIVMRLYKDSNGSPAMSPIAGKAMEEQAFVMFLLGFTSIRLFFKDTPSEFFVGFAIEEKHIGVLAVFDEVTQKQLIFRMPAIRLPSLF